MEVAHDRAAKIEVAATVKLRKTLPTTIAGVMAVPGVLRGTYGPLPRLRQDRRLWRFPDIADAHGSAASVSLELVPAAVAVQETPASLDARPHGSSAFRAVGAHAGDVDEGHGRV